CTLGKGSSSTARRRVCGCRGSISMIQTELIGFRGGWARGGLFHERSRAHGAGSRRHPMIRRLLPAFCSLLASVSCAPVTHYRMPESLRGYTVLIENRDSSSDALAAAFRHHGMHVQRAVRGGRGPTAA